MLDKDIIQTPDGIVISSGQTKPAVIVGSATERAAMIMSAAKPTVNQYKLPEYTIENTNGVFINLDSFSTPAAFQEFLDILFKSGHYFEDFQYQAITEILFNFEKIEQKKEQISASGGSPLIRIAASIRKFDSVRAGFYRKPLIARDKKSVDYFFEAVYHDEDRGDGKIVETLKELTVDEFIAALWNYGIRFGFDIEGIKHAISSKKRGLVKVVNELEATESIHPTMESVISFDIKLGAKDTGNSRADMLNYEQPFIRVNKDTPIYKKKAGELGKVGWDIAGNMIQPDPIKDFSISSFVGEGVYVKVIDGVEYLVSSYNGFPRLEEGPIIQGRNRVQGLLKVHVDEDKVFEQIGMETGRVTVNEGVVSEQDIILDTTAKTVLAKKNVEANIHATGDITIEGNLIGVAQSNILSHRHQKVSGSISKGIIESENGNITVQGHSNDAHIRANNGIVSVSNVANSVIIGKTVEITGIAFNCTIVADIIILNGKTIGCKCVVGKTLQMNEATQKSYHENVIYMFAYDLSQSIAKKQLLRQQAIAKIQEIESKIDTEIVDRFASLAKIETGKRISMTRILVELMKDPEKCKDEKYKSHLQVYQALSPILKKYGMDWKKVSDLNNYLTSISAEIQQESELMKSSLDGLFLQIKNIAGPVILYQIDFFEGKKITELSSDEILLISNAIIGSNPDQGFSIKDFPVNQSGGFEWKAT